METEGESAENIQSTAFSASPPRSPLSEAPAFFILLSLVLSIYLDEFFAAPAAAAAGLLISAAALMLCTREARRGFFPVFLTVMLISSLACGYSLYLMNRKAVLPGSVETRGSVLSVRRRRYDSALLIGTSYGRFAGYLRGNYLPREGSGVYLRGALFDFKRVKKKGGFDEERYWRSRGAVKKIVLFEIREISPPKRIARWRAALAELIDERLAPLTSAYMAAFTVGRRDDAAIEGLHKRAGTSHLLAVSGLHVWIIAGLILSLLPLRGMLRFAAASASIWLYLLVSGLPVGGVRSALMIQIMLLSAVVGRPSSAFNNVSAASALLLLANPWSFYALGWRLSVAGALFVSASVPLFRSSLCRAVCVPVLLWFVTAPFIASAFGEAPLAGLALNAALVPAFGVIFPLVLILSIPPLFELPGAWIASAASESILEALQNFIDAGASLFSGAALFNPALFSASVVIFSAACALRCGSGLQRALLLSVFFLLFMLYSAAM